MTSNHHDTEDRAVAIFTAILNTTGDGEHTLVATIQETGLDPEIAVLRLASEGNRIAMVGEEMEAVLNLIVRAKVATAAAVVRYSATGPNAARFCAWEIAQHQPTPYTAAEVLRTRRDIAGILPKPPPGLEFVDAPPLDLS